MPAINPVHRKLGLILIAIGAVFLLSSCASYLPVIPVTGLEAIKPVALWQKIAMAAIGGIFLLAGFSLVKILIQLLGFLAGGILGVYLVQLWLPSLNYGGLVGFFVGGLIGIGLALTATNFGVFLSGALLGAAMIQQVWPYLEKQPAPLLGLIVAAILGGILTLWLFKIWVAALTSAVGAVLVGMAFNLPPLLWAIFFAVGLLVQTLFSKAAGQNRRGNTEHEPHY